MLIDLAVDNVFGQFIANFLELLSVGGKMLEALDDDQTLRRFDDLADLAWFEAKGRSLHLLIAGCVAAERRNFAARGRQLRIGLLLGNAVEFLLAVADFGVELEYLPLLRTRPEDDPAVELFAVVGNEGVLQV